MVSNNQISISNGNSWHVLQFLFKTHKDPIDAVRYLIEEYKADESYSLQNGFSIPSRIYEEAGNQTYGDPESFSVIEAAKRNAYKTLNYLLNDSRFGLVVTRKIPIYSLTAAFPDRKNFKNEEDYLSKGIANRLQTLDILLNYIYKYCNVTTPLMTRYNCTFLEYAARKDASFFVFQYLLQPKYYDLVGGPGGVYLLSVFKELIEPQYSGGNILCLSLLPYIALPNPMYEEWYNSFNQWYISWVESDLSKRPKFKYLAYALYKKGLVSKNYGGDYTFSPM
jgi:hypothetical protein